MSDINNDILHTSLVMNGRRFPNYNRVYFYSNENVKDILEKVDVKDKKVLSVLGSGDQAFHLINHGSKKTDVFDINKLTIYYYYLRRWCIKYLNKYYPNDNFSIRFIKELLKLVDIRNVSEKNAFDYWCKYIEMFDDKRSNKLFYRGMIENTNDLEDFSKIRERINDDVKFYNVDISDNVGGINGKYDVIYVSNIPDYVTSNYVSFIKYKNNILKLLNDNGFVISTRLRKRYGNSEMIENEVFSDDFDMEILDDTLRFGVQMPLGKIYSKK